MIERTFQIIPDGKIGEADQQSFLVSLGWSRGTTWDDLLRSRRVLISVRSDYRSMENMIFGEAPDFEEILVVLQALEDEINTPFGKI